MILKRMIIDKKYLIGRAAVKGKSSTLTIRRLDKLAGETEPKLHQFEFYRISVDNKSFQYIVTTTVPFRMSTGCL